MSRPPGPAVHPEQAAARNERSGVEGSPGETHSYEAIVGGVGIRAERVCVVALGNSLAADDGVAHAVLDEFERRGARDDVVIVRAFDASVLIDLALTHDRIVMVDAAVGGGEVGTVIEVSPEELEESAVALCSTHGLSVRDAIAMARSIAPDGKIAAIRIVAVVIEGARRLESGLSPVVAAAVPIAVGTLSDLVSFKGSVQGR